MNNPASEKITINPDDLFILKESTGEIDLKRSRNDYLDLKEILQRTVNESDDPFPVDHKTHVEPTVQNAYEVLRNAKKESPEVQAYLNAVELDNGETIYFTFGLPTGMNGFTISTDDSLTVSFPTIDLCVNYLTGELGCKWSYIKETILNEKGKYTHGNVTVVYDPEN